MAESAIPYRHYEPSLLEPVHPQRTRHLEDLAVSLTSKAGQLTRGLHPIVLRSVLKRLIEQGLLVADSPKGAVRLGFPTKAVEQWLPRLRED
ncbi:hypothetical protein [Microseira sp. BLCC-F43]|jgi:hypothetical protein|uniref:hypothetical protein n=1 Tax=Microseira sp. BLCC-F43 TaxID=3153602 RepID=UPI0035BA7129